MHSQLTIATRQKRELIDITDQVEAVVARSGLREGLCLVFIQHTTAALVINDVSDGFIHDFLLTLDGLPDRRYTHLHAGPQHPKDHILGAALGESKTLPVVDARLAFGTWQRLYLVELDGPRQRQVLVMPVAAP